MMGWYGDGVSAPGGWMMMTLLMLAFWALVVLGSVLLHRNLARGDRAPQDGPDGAQQILEQRYARGEIDADEYATRRETLAAARR
jgi:putative membrane protein